MKIPSLLRPRHTLTSVVQTLLTGLNDGSVVFEPTLKLFPTFGAALEDLLSKRSQDDAVMAVAEFLPDFIDRLAKRETAFVGTVTDLESFLELLQELRQHGTCSKEDVTWYWQTLATELDKLPPFIRESRQQSIEEIAKLTKVLELAIDQHETAVLQEVNIQLQLAVAELLNRVLLGIRNVFSGEVEATWKSLATEKYYKLAQLAQLVESALQAAVHSKSADLDARIELLRLALVREQATTRDAIDASIIARREPRRQA